MRPMSSGGFTEDDQARIAEEVLGRVGAKRTGLGFSGGGGGAQPAKGNASSSSSGWFEQHTQSAAREEYVGNETRDTTAGPFAWDGGQRGKAKGDARKKDDRGVTRIAPSREADGPAEREFPMVRERDIERSRGRRDEKSRKRSRSRSRGRRSRSRSRSRERRRERQRERERQRGRAKEWERDRDRERERERERERDRERNRRSRRSKSPPSTRFRDGARKPQRGNETGRKATGAITTAEQAKAAVKRRLRQVVASDATLKSGAKATTGGGTSWERPEMSTASEFFQSDEVASKGGVASVASEYEARLAEILAVENEEVMCLGDKAQPVAGAGSTSSSALEQKHHDAIFAPTGAVSQPITSVPAATPAAGIRSVGAIGAAGRARLALTGKLGKESTAKPKSTPSSAGQSIKRAEEHSQPRRDDSDQPLFKTLRVCIYHSHDTPSPHFFHVSISPHVVISMEKCIRRSGGNVYCLHSITEPRAAISTKITTFDEICSLYHRVIRTFLFFSRQTGESVEACYTADDKWYGAIVLQVIHGGFEIAR